MSELDESGLIFDQAGQLVATQFNAQSIKLVQQLKDSPAGKVCPRCGAVPLRKTSVVWEENTRRVSNGTVVLNYLASRVAPPQRPRPGNRSFPIAKYLVLPAVLLVPCCCCNAGNNDIFTSDPADLARLGIQLASAVGIIAALAWAAVKHSQFKQEVSADQTSLQQGLIRYEHDRTRWRRSWFCSACGGLTESSSS